MVKYLRKFTDSVSYFYSQRSTGHGIQLSIDEVPKDTDLLIILDSSSNDADAIRQIKNSGIDIIVLDHHQIEVENPYCILVNPQQENCNYPNKSISGSVVTWKVCQTLDDYFQTNYADEYFDLVAIGLVGDVMSLMEYENRYIVSKGINNVRNIGIRALLEESKKDQNRITVNDIGFLISPIINAACRMDKIEMILELLVEDDPVQAKIQAKKVIEMNEERKRIQKYFYNKLINEIKDSDSCSIIIDDEIGKGFKGLVAGTFCEEFRKSVMIVSEDEDGTYSGSYRSYGMDNFKQFLNDIPEVISAAGHATVGGIKFKKEDLDKLQRYLNKNIASNHEEQYLEYILEFDVDELNSKMIKSIEEFYAISGEGFKTGRFLIKNITSQKKEILGKERNTVKIPCVASDSLIFMDAEEINALKPKLTLMKFRSNEDYFDESDIGQELQAVGTLNLNSWKNPRTHKVTNTIQLFIDDYKVTF